MTIVPLAPAQVLSGPAPPIEIRGPSQNLAPGITLAMTTDAAQQYEEFVSALGAALGASSEAPAGNAGDLPAATPISAQDPAEAPPPAPAEETPPPAGPHEDPPPPRHEDPPQEAPQPHNSSHGGRRRARQ